MARGWESKEIESQMEAAAESHRLQADSPRFSPDDLKVVRERESLELSRTRVLQDIEQSTNPGYRLMLERSLQFLDEKLAALPALSKPDLHG